ncbi:Uncharacterized protein YR821_1379 [Yersinia ruckeri]|uniref:Uncharacterized protein n=1 Tax=Yersinia ruckeri TaxID=29486 RepID=A0A0A8VGY6_YERRU|nr:Uncharacterized protein YR821_1379 [Yersinia ruckeri]CEK27209.1 hypothetical protein CSF007_7265 [Yersinia ruckeri]
MAFLRHNGKTDSIKTPSKSPLPVICAVSHPICLSDRQD